MDKMVKLKLFNGIYEGTRVFLTGHTGFKGSWLAFWLMKMGAIVKGYALAPITYPSHWQLLNLDMESKYWDIRDREKLEKELISFKPDIVIHMAAQPLVRLSYLDPFETYETNVIGTLALFEACRKSEGLRAIVNITTDKCYENREWVWGYRENDPMGGFDPYSSSKGCVEIMTSAYRRSFFNIGEYGQKHNVLMASVRAGNVIGGGDWAADRLVPDIMKATHKNESVEIRNPNATRPWQHVLEPLSGYLLLGQRLLEGVKEFADGWNFGPGDKGALTVAQVTEYLSQNWRKIKISLAKQNPTLHEAGLLRLDCTKAHAYLKWFDVWNSEQTFRYTTEWYKEFYENNAVITDFQLDHYVNDAVSMKYIWTT
jgi:CDP-glucose 4,6-dehydratase